MAAQYAPDTERQTFKKAIFYKGLLGIDRAGRVKSTGGLSTAEKSCYKTRIRRKKPLVPGYYYYERPRRELDEMMSEVRESHMRSVLAPTMGPLA